MLAWGIADFLAKLIVDRLGAIRGFIWQQLFGLPILILLIPLSRGGMDVRTAAYMCVFGLTSVFYYLPLYSAFEKGKVSIVSPLFASYTGIVSLISIFVFGEHVDVVRSLALCTMFAGIILSGVDLRAIRRVKFPVWSVSGFPEIAIAVACFSVWLATYGHFVAAQDWILSLVVVRAALLPVVGVYAFASRVSIPTDRRLWPILAGIGVCDVAGFSSLTAGLSLTDHVSIVAMVSGAFSLPTIVLARVLLKEQATGWQTAGGLITVASVMLLAIG